MSPPGASSASTSAGKGEGEAGKKRKRVSRACDQCFLKKDRCDGVHPICTFCAQLGRACTYLRPERKRGPTQGLRPKLEHHITTLETLLGLVLQRNPALDARQLDRVSTASEAERRAWREHWLGSALRARVRAAEWTSMASRDEVENKVLDEATEESDVDLALPPTHVAQSRAEDQQPPPQPREPLLSSGKGGSSLNRGLVPRGADPNAALGGFEIQFGGNQTDEDWVRRFIPHQP